MSNFPKKKQSSIYQETSVMKDPLMSIRSVLKSSLFLLLLLFVTIETLFASNKLVLLGGNDNNELVHLIRENGVVVTKAGSMKEALKLAGKNGGILILNSENEEIRLSEKQLKELQKKKIKAFIEMPSEYPGIKVEENTLKVHKERVVMLTEGIPGLERWDILGYNQKEILQIDKVNSTGFEVLAVMAKVAGFDKADYKLEGAVDYPFLLKPDEHIIISMGNISGAIQGRFGPNESWRLLWEYLVRHLTNDEEFELKGWKASARPSFNKEVPVSDNMIDESVGRATEWFYDAKLMVHDSWQHVYEERASVNGREVVYPSIGAEYPLGNGDNGILEGHASRINPDGTQPYRWWIRGDCQAEVAFALSSASGFLNANNKKYEATATNLLNYLFRKSNLRQGERNDPNSPSFGLIGWATTDPDAYYGDDNARLLIAAIGATSNLNSHEWDSYILEGIIGNFRTTGRNGFRGPWFRDADMQKTSWDALSNREIINVHPHYESWLWACYLWLYDKTGYEPLLESAEKAIRYTMQHKDEWKWTNGIQQEYVRMILPLSWLIQVNDDPQYISWLNEVVDHLLDDLDESGAIKERLGKKGFGRYDVVKSNEEYGTKEAPLISKYGDPVTDLLYTMNFALFSLNEAAEATGDVKFSKAAQKIAHFLVKAQIDSPVHKDLNGAWVRAFDFGRWEYWASNADSDWGPWGTLTGWTQSWIINGLVYTTSKKSLWEQSKSHYTNKTSFKEEALHKMKQMTVK